jgi:lipopolysaccharide exporter
MSLKKRAFAGVKWTGISTLGTTAIQALEIIILARLLKPEEFGMMAMVMVVIGFAQGYADMGISAAIIHRQDITERQLSSLYWTSVSAGIAVFVLTLITAPVIAFFFKEPGLTGLLRVAAASFVISAFGSQFQVLLQKELRFNTLAALEVMNALVTAGSAVVLAALGYGVWSIVWASLLGAGFRAAFLMANGFPRWRPGLLLSRRELKGFLSFGLYQTGERSINFFNSRVDQILVGRLLGAEALGFYNFAFNLVVQPTLRINPILTRVAFPVFSMVQTDDDRLRRGYIKLLHAVSLVNAPVIFGLSVVAPMAVPMIFGEKWQPAIPLLQIMCVYAFIRSTGNPVGSLVLARGKADLSFKWNLALLAVVAPVVYLAGRAGGLIGIALGLACMQACLAAANYIFLVRPLIGRCLVEYVRAILRPAVLAVLMCLPVVLFGMVAPKSPWSLAAQVCLGFLSFGFLVFRFERDIIREFGRLFGPR